MEIEFIDEQSRISEEDKNLVIELLIFATEKLGLSPKTELSLTIVDNKTIQEINRTYRGKDFPTDVISFAIDEEDESNDFPEINYQDIDDENDVYELILPNDIGDIIISVEKAQEQALDYGHSFERELGFLAVHGFLHLNGYDHQNEDDEKEMFTLQEEILDEYGLRR